MRIVTGLEPLLLIGKGCRMLARFAHDGFGKPPARHAIAVDGCNRACAQLACELRQYAGPSFVSGVSAQRSRQGSAYWSGNTMQPFPNVHRALVAAVAEEELIAAIA